MFSFEWPWSEATVGNADDVASGDSDSSEEEEDILESTSDFCLESYYCESSTRKELEQMLNEHVLSELPLISTVPVQHVLSVAHLPTCDPYPLFRRLSRAGTIVWQRHETDSLDLMNHLNKWKEGKSLSKNGTPVVLCLSYRSGQENRAQPFLHRALEAAALHPRLPHWLVLVVNGDQAYSSIGIDRDTMARAKAHILLPDHEETERLVSAWLVLTEAAYANICNSTRQLGSLDDMLIKQPPYGFELPDFSKKSWVRSAAEDRQDFVIRLSNWKEAIVAACVNHGWLQVSAWLTGVLHGYKSHNWSTWLDFANSVLHDGDGDQIRRIGGQKVSTQFRRYFNYTQGRYTEPPQPIGGKVAEEEEGEEDTEEMSQWPPKRPRASLTIPKNPFKAPESESEDAPNHPAQLSEPTEPTFKKPSLQTSSGKQPRKKRNCRRE